MAGIYDSMMTILGCEYRFDINLIHHNEKATVFKQLGNIYLVAEGVPCLIQSP